MCMHMFFKDKGGVLILLLEINVLGPVCTCSKLHKKALCHLVSYNIYKYECIVLD